MDIEINSVNGVNDVNNEYISDIDMNKYIDQINRFILEVYDIRNKIIDIYRSDKSDKIDKKTKIQYMEKFRLIVGIITIYRNKDIFANIHEYITKNKKQQQNKKNDEIILNNCGPDGLSEDIMHPFFRNLFADDEQLEKNDESIYQSDIEDDDFHQDKYLQFIRDSYEKINNMSVIRHNMSIDRCYIAKFVDDDTNNEDIKI